MRSWQTFVLCCYTIAGSRCFDTQKLFNSTISKDTTSASELQTPGKSEFPPPSPEQATISRLGTEGCLDADTAALPVGYIHESVTGWIPSECLQSTTQLKRLGDEFLASKVELERQSGRNDTQTQDTVPLQQKKGIGLRARLSPLPLPVLSTLSASLRTSMHSRSNAIAPNATGTMTEPSKCKSQQIEHNVFDCQCSSPSYLPDGGKLGKEASVCSVHSVSKRLSEAGWGPTSGSWQSIQKHLQESEVQESENSYAIGGLFCMI